jgi:flagellin
MAQVINTNVMSLNSQRVLNRTNNQMQTALERLSSGLRINRAKDDAAGLAIAMVQTAEGALDEIGNMLQRMRELAVQSRNDTVSSADKSSLNDEFKELKAEITRVIRSTEFNNTNLLNTGTTLTLQVGDQAGTNFQINISTVTLSGTGLAAGGLSGVLAADQEILSAGTASVAMNDLTTAIDNISALRADFGAKQSRLESTIRNNENIIENQSAARSRIMDADFARETANLTRTQILQQAGTAMLAQGNAVPQNVLSLLR